ncbi:GLPGLI family protein [Pontimicrobium sp. MEBiC06410]
MKYSQQKIKISLITFLITLTVFAQDFQGKAYYFSKSTMDLGRWGAKMSEVQKKQIKERLKNRLEKTYVLTFNKAESIFVEDEKLDAISGATDSWGKNFTAGDQYKNVKTNVLIQNQEFYGKRFLVKDKLQKIDWKLSTETKKIGDYNCYKATATMPTASLKWYSFSWSELRQKENQKEGEMPMTAVEAWYTPQIPISQGPLEYWGLPGLILEVSADNTTMLCYKITINPEEKVKIEAPDRGKEIAKLEYKEIIVSKMQEMRNNRGRRR